MFSFRSPYPFVGVPDQDPVKVAYTDGSYLSCSGKGKYTVEVDDTLGKWSPLTFVHQGEGEKVDISNTLAMRYEFRVRVTLEKEASLSQFKFESYLMTAPGSLPRLVEGENAMTLKAGGDKYGLKTIPCPMVQDFRASATPTLDKVWVDAKNVKLQEYTHGFQEAAPVEADKPVEMTFRYEAPAGGKIAWFYVLGAFREGPAGQPKKKARFEWSLDGKEFKPFAEGEIDNTPKGWDSSADGELKLPQPEKRVFVRVVSDTAVCRFDLHAHLDFSAVKTVLPQVIHRWFEGADKAEKTFNAPEGATSYKIPCGAKPSGHLIEMKMPSQKR